MGTVIVPKLDYMIVKKHEKKSALYIPDGKETIAQEMIPFEVVSIGPGRWEHGTFIKTTIKPGDMVFISGGVLQTKFRDQQFLFAREKDVVAHLSGKYEI